MNNNTQILKECAKSLEILSENISNIHNEIESQVYYLEDRLKTKAEVQALKTIKNELSNLETYNNKLYGEFEDIQGLASEEETEDKDFVIKYLKEHLLNAVGLDEYRYLMRKANIEDNN